MRRLPSWIPGQGIPAAAAVALLLVSAAAAAQGPAPAAAVPVGASVPAAPPPAPKSVPAASPVPPALATAMAALPAGSTTSFTTFQVIGNFNIFNSNRIGYVPGSEQARMDTISLVGTMQSDKGRLALFDSTDRNNRKGVHEGETIAEFTVTKITEGGVELMRDSKPLSMKLGQELRRPVGGAWTLGSMRRADPAAAAAAAASAPAIPTDASDIIKQLMEQRQKLQK